MMRIWNALLRDKKADGTELLRPTGDQSQSVLYPMRAPTSATYIKKLPAAGKVARLGRDRTPTEGMYLYSKYAACSKRPDRFAPRGRRIL